MAVRLSKEERIEAEIWAAHLICCRVREFDVRKQLRKKFSCTGGVASSIVAKVRQEQTAVAEQTRAEMLRQAYATLDEATALAFQTKDVRAVVQVERLRAELGGLIGADAHMPTGGDGDGERMEHSEAEYQCIAVMGKLPAELTGDEREIYSSFLAQTEGGEHPTQ